ncbi:beta strand repeat-containing protein [Erythrobacter sp. R86502]|uniref:beta strand repeat-containing protein n=1 Tax=Erythrobacter sp. R86502 TaxID=3093846 RepID=UPI0036D2AF47
MRKTILTGASVLALSIAVPAFGQTAPSTPTYPSTPAECASAGNNCSTIDQAGTDGNAILNQSGSANVSAINQTAASANVDAKVTQEGTNATSFVEQSGGPGVFVPNASGTFVRNKIEVSQKGDGADSVIYQGKSSRLQVGVNQDGDSTSYVNQEGNNSAVEVTQTGDANDSIVFQSANTSTVGLPFNGNQRTGVVQTGSENTSGIYQGDLSTTSIDERDLTANVIQNGVNNDSFISQTNSGGRAEATAEVNQQGNDNMSLVQQSGLLGDAFPVGTIVDVDQFGNDNMSDVVQENNSTRGDATPASAVIIKQFGDQNDSTVNQSSTSGSAKVTQTSEGINPTSPRARDNRFDGGTDTVRGNFSNIRQSGLGQNDATLNQTGQLNRSDIRQSNVDGIATATVVQDGTFNNSDIRQTAAAEATVNQLGSYGDNDSSIEQNADGATAIVNQFGNNTTNGPSFPTNQSFITQSDDASAMVTQTGSQNLSTVNQNSGAFEAVAVVNQQTDPTAIGSGDDVNESTITQSATTSAFVNQIGQGNFSNVNQSGGNASPDNGFMYAVQIDQLGQDGSSTVTQTGMGNEASLMQLAGSELAESTITQGGNDNLALVTQGGLDNFSSVIQSGDNNTATVNQYSNGNSSYVTQGGNGNSATVNQGVAPSIGG